MTKVPYIEGLRIKNIIAMAREYVEIDRYLPEIDEDKYPCREFL